MIKEKEYYNKSFKTIDFFLYHYELLNKKQELLSEEIEGVDLRSTYNKWLKRKSSSTEDVALRNIDLEIKKAKVLKWKELIDEVINFYKENEEIKYKYFIFKYIKRYSSKIIEQALNLTENEQKEMQIEIRKYVFLLAISKELLRKEANE